MEVSQTEIAKLNELFASGLILEEEYNQRRQELGTTDEKSLNNNISVSTSAPKDSAVEPPIIKQVNNLFRAKNC